MICMSSCILIVAFISSMSMGDCYRCYNEVYPLVLTGIGYSIYCASIWASIPYVVKPHTVGTAFGIATAIQNIGLVIAPTLVGMIKDSTQAYGHGYFYVSAFFAAINVFGLLLNMTIYYMDIYHYDGVLDKVDSGVSQEKDEIKAE